MRLRFTAWRTVTIVITPLLALALTLVLTAPRAPHGPPPVSFESALLASTTKNQNVAVILESIALDPRGDATVRSTALRRLEEQAPDRVVPIAERLARTEPCSREGDFLRTNSKARRSGRKPVSPLGAPQLAVLFVTWVFLSIGGGSFLCQ